MIMCVLLCYPVSIRIYYQQGGLFLVKTTLPIALFLSLYFSTHRLDQLGYRQPLGIESLPLVERLFADLVHTTESLKKAKLDLTKSPQDKGTITAHIEAYKSDNAKLVKENNDLHQQFIKTKERDEAQIKGKS